MDADDAAAAAEADPQAAVGRPDDGVDRAARQRRPAIDGVHGVKREPSNRISPFGVPSQR